MAHSTMRSRKAEMRLKQTGKCLYFDLSSYSHPPRGPSSLDDMGTLATMKGSAYCMINREPRGMRPLQNGGF